MEMETPTQQFRHAYFHHLCSFFDSVFLTYNADISKYKQEHSIETFQVWHFIFVQKAHEESSQYTIHKTQPALIVLKFGIDWSV